jgi:hypothetical protein
LTAPARPVIYGLKFPDGFGNVSRYLAVFRTEFGSNGSRSYGGGQRC